MALPATEQHIAKWKIALRDLVENGPQSSWDWGADLRFAQALENEEAAKIIKAVIESDGVQLIREAYMKSGEVKKVHEQRLTALRRLTQANLAVSFWQGLGDGAVSDFGINKIRVWEYQDAEADRTREDWSFAEKGYPEEDIITCWDQYRFKV